MQKIVPNLWFDHNAEEAVAFYTSVFPDSRILERLNYPAEVPDFQKDLAGEVVTIDFELYGYRFTAINAGPEFSFTPATSFFVVFDDTQDPDARQQLDKLWAALADGGQVLMPLDAYGFSKHYGWIQDRYGLSWQLILGEPERDWRPAIVPCLLFGNTAQNRAKEALEYYASVFPDSRKGQLVPYPEATEAAEAGSVMFGDVELAGVWIAAMDSAVPQTSTFTEAVSFAVMCDSQEEIDRYWERLSKVPEAEQCGWCKDQYGVSWQIVPSNEAELLKRPGAWGHLMGMKKLVIDEY